MFKIKSKSILMPLFGLVIITTIGTLISVGTAVYFLHETMMSNKIQEAHDLTESARTLIKMYDERLKNGEYDEKTGQELAKAAVRNMHYGKNNSEYFFIYDDKGISIVHGAKPELEGKSRMDAADSQGYKYMPDLIAKAKNGGGHLFYYFPKAGETEGSKKVSYATYYEPWNWVIGTGIYVDDIEADLNKIITRLAEIVFVVLALVLGLAVSMANSLARPIRALSQTAHDMSRGNYQVHVPATERIDEIGGLAKAIDTLRGEAKAAETMRQEQEESKVRTEQERRAGMLALAEKFEASVLASVNTIILAVHDNSDAADTLGLLTDRATEEASQVSSTVNDANQNTQLIAAAADELLASIREISSRVQQSNTVANQAVAKASETDIIVKGLNDAVMRITDVVGLISEVASQTNLLALNATIEAARAGEAGKGFAVVAGEVKSLATQTAKATDEIAIQIEAVKQATALAITSIKEISVTIASVSEVTTSIAAAVEEQSAATNEIARNVNKAAQGVDAVAGFVERLASITTDVKGGVVTVAQATTTLNTQSEILHREVEKFVADIKG